MLDYYSEALSTRFSEPKHCIVVSLRVAVDHLTGTARRILTVIMASIRLSRIPPNAKDNH